MASLLNMIWSGPNFVPRLFHLPAPEMKEPGNEVGPDHAGPRDPAARRWAPTSPTRAQPRDVGPPTSPTWGAQGLAAGAPERLRRRLGPCWSGISKYQNTHKPVSTHVNVVPAESGIVVAFPPARLPSPGEWKICNRKRREMRTRTSSRQMNHKLKQSKKYLYSYTR